jgi:hypothetical protein
MSHFKFSKVYVESFVHILFTNITDPFSFKRATVKLASDWLGFDLEVMSLCSWPISQTENHRIEEWLESKYGRVLLDLSPLTST